MAKAWDMLGLGALDLVSSGVISATLHQLRCPSSETGCACDGVGVWAATFV